MKFIRSGQEDFSKVWVEALRNLGATLVDLGSDMGVGGMIPYNEKLSILISEDSFNVPDSEYSFPFRVSIVPTKDITDPGSTVDLEYAWAVVHVNLDRATPESLQEDLKEAIQTVRHSVKSTPERTRPTFGHGVTDLCDIRPSPVDPDAKEAPTGPVPPETPAEVPVLSDPALAQKRDEILDKFNKGQLTKEKMQEELKKLRASLDDLNWISKLPWS